MLINLSNHPLSKWDSKQKRVAESQYGTLLDLPFPSINPKATEVDIKAIAIDYFEKVTTIIDECANEPKPNAVHIQGEFTLVYALVTMLIQSGIKCIASTTQRKVELEEDGKKISIFEFVQFREYII